MSSIHSTAVNVGNPSTIIPPSSIEVFYASPETRAMYEDEFEVAKEKLSGNTDVFNGLASLQGDIPLPKEGSLSLLVIRRSDLGSNTPDLEGWNSWNSCFPSGDYDTDVMSEQYEKAKQKTLNIFVDSGFMSEEKAMQLSLRRYREVGEMVDGVSSMVVSDSASSTYLPSLFDRKDGLPNIESRMAVIVMEDASNSPIAEFADISGIDISNVRSNLEGNPALFTALHEVAHAALNHSSTLENNDYCADANTEVFHEDTLHETAADTVFGRAYDKEDGFVDAIASARSITALQGNSNIFTVFVNDENGAPQGISGEWVNDHITTWGFDPDAKDMRSEFNLAAMDGIALMPLMINTYTDATAGFLYEQRQLATLQDIRLSDEERRINVLSGEPLSDEEIARFEELSENGLPSIGEEFKYYSQIGENIRYEYHDFHYALVKSMDFEPLKAKLSPEYANAMQDSIDDYLSGIEDYTVGIEDKKFVETIRGTVKEEIDQTQLAETLIQYARDASEVDISSGVINITQTDSPYKSAFPPDKAFANGVLDYEPKIEFSN